jgi:hypothetical protein
MRDMDTMAGNKTRLFAAAENAMRQFARLLLVCVLFAGCVAPPSAERLASMQKQGDGIIAKIEAFQAEKGRLPASLKEAGVENYQTPYGPWKYSTKDGAIVLFVGDYATDQFEIWWEPVGHNWYVDT